MTERKDPKRRTDELLMAALHIAAKGGWRTLTHQAVAEHAGVSPGLVVARLGTKTEMLRDVMRAAVRHRVARVVAEGLALGDIHARKADDALRQDCSALMRAP